MIYIYNIFFLFKYKTFDCEEEFPREASPYLRKGIANCTSSDPFLLIFSFAPQRFYLFH